MSEKKKVTTAQLRATKKYEDKAYDKVMLRLSKGRKADIQFVAAASGKSTNAYIAAAIELSMSGNATPQNEILVKPETMAKITEHIKGTDETPDAFIDRAVTDTIDRDMFTRRLAKK